MDKELIEAIIALLNAAEPKRESETKTVPTALLNKLSERLAELGV